MYSVGSEEEAQALIVIGCQRDMAGNYYAQALLRSQTFEELENFAKRLHRIHEEVLRPNRRCTCKETQT